MSDVEEEDGGNCTGDEAGEVLSPPVEAARQALRANYKCHRKRCWNVTHGKVVGDFRQTPPRESWGDVSSIADGGGHSDWFPQNMCDILSRAEEWVDVTSLAPPDGVFLQKFQEALMALHESGNAVTIRMLFGNIVGMPADVDDLCETLTKDIPQETSIKLWVGAWRKGLSWNHSKIIAVDGKYLFEGGHNLWDPHYLQNDPVHDVSMEAEGQVACDGHVFANRMWQFIVETDDDYWIKKQLPDWVPIPCRDRVNVAQFPKAAREYPAMYVPPSQPLPLAEAREQGDVPILSCGRYGNLHANDVTSNPSDGAIVALLVSATKIIRMSLQDLGPITLPGFPTLTPIPGGVWPQQYLHAAAVAMWSRGVDVEIVLSNPFACPGGLSPMTANYGNGWTASDVASECIKAIMALDEYEEEDDAKLRKIVEENLRVTTLCVEGAAEKFPDEQTIGNHAKFFVVDDLCYYVGSQNLYIADLAEWGLVIDSEEQTAKVLEEYWNPMWEQSYSPDKCDVDAVMDGLGVDRNGSSAEDASEEEKAAVALAKKRAGQGGSGTNSLDVWVKRAEGLKDADSGFGGSSDSYVRVRLVDGDGQTVMGPRKTHVVENGGANPEWNEHICFEGLDTPGAYTLKITVLDKDSVLGMENAVADMMAADDKLGATTFDLGTLDCSEEWQDQELIIADGWFSDSKVFLALNNKGEWGN